MKFQQTLVYSTCLFFFTAGLAHAAVLLTANDNYGIPPSGMLTVEPFGVLENDTLDGENAGDLGVTVTLLTNVSKGALSCPKPGSTLKLCADGSFEYTPNASFDGADSFQYQAAAISGESAIATVTLTACSAGATATSFFCWHENAYLAKLVELSYNTIIQEGFEGTAWADVRTPDLGAAITASSITSKNITWTTNHPLTNGITTGRGAARTGLWGGFDPGHGFTTGVTPAECNNVEIVPISCRPHDGLSGSGTALHAVGGYFKGDIGANIAVILDGANQIGNDRWPDANYHFIGVIETAAAGFTYFEFQEQDGKLGQELRVFADDFIIATANASVDSDGDGVNDNADNCILIANPLQRNTDGDAFGNFCDPDFNNDLIVNAADLGYLKSSFFSSDPDADLNGDGVVNAGDLAILKSFFFQPPG